MMRLNVPVDMGRLQSKLHLDEIRATLARIASDVAGRATKRWDRLIDIQLLPTWGDEHEWAVSATGSPGEVAAIRRAVNIFAVEHL